ncbi:MAG: DciA family protein [Pseudomonadales bacterium]
MQKIDELLKEGHRRFTPLQKLLDKASDQEVWTAELGALLPATLVKGVSVTDIKGRYLTVSCRNASIATRLRFQVPELLPRLRALGHFAEVTDITIRVAELQSHDFDAS